MSRIWHLRCNIPRFFQHFRPGRETIRMQNRVRCTTGVAGVLTTGHRVAAPRTRSTHAPVRAHTYH